MSIPDEVRKCVVYLYRKTKKNLEPVGTAFFVIYEIEHFENNKLVMQSNWIYAVTSRHVVEKIRLKGIDDQVHIAMNSSLDGRTIFYQIPVSSWHFPGGSRSDVAVVEAPFAFGGTDQLCFPKRGFLSQDDLNEWGIGPGDRIYFSGLFSKRPGAPGNVPIIRTGSIAAMPSGEIKTEFSDVNAYLVEALSIGGMSGSPVFYSQEGYSKTISSNYEPPNSARGLYLLGYVQGHYDERHENSALNQGIAVVVPSEDILAALEHPVFADKRNSEFQQYLEDYAQDLMPTDD